MKTADDGLTEEEQDFMEMIINWQMENPRVYEEIKAFADISVSRATLFSALADYSNIKQSIIKIIDEMIENKKKQIYKSLSEYLGEANIPAGRITILNLMAENESIICDELATELKEKLK